MLFLLIAVIVIIPSLTTCETLQALLQEPIVTLRSVELAKISFTGIDLLCKVNVENRTALELPVPDFDWELFINTNSFVKGSIGSGGYMRSRQTNIVEIPVSLSFTDIFATFQSLKGSQSAGFRVALGAKLNIPVIGERIWNFSHEGVFPVLQIPKFSMPSMKIDSIDFSKVQLAFSLNVENPNRFDLPAPQLLYDFFVNRNVNANSYRSGVSVSAAPLAAAAVTPVIIALTLEYADLFRVFSNLLTMGEVPGLLALSGGFNIPAFAGETVSQEITGSIPLLRPPAVSFSGIRVRDYNITGVNFELSLTIENKNVFAMNVNDLFYNFSVNNSQWSSGRVPRLTQINANSSRTVTFDFSINQLAVVAEIIRIITGGTSITYTMSGSINLGADLMNLSNLQMPFSFSGNTSLR